MSAPNLIYLTAPYVAGSGVFQTNPLGPIISGFDCVTNQVTISAPNSPISTVYAITGTLGGSRVVIGGVISGADQNYPVGSTLSFLLVPSSSGLTLTTTGSSGPSTLTGSVLNVPQYSGGGGGSGTVGSGTIGLPAVYTGSTAVGSSSTPVIPTSVITFASTTNLDASLSNSLQVTLTGNVTFTVSNAKVDQVFRVNVIQGGSGSNLATWFGGLTWASGSAPTLQTAVGAVDTVVIWCRSAGVYEGYPATPTAGGGSGTVTTSGSPASSNMAKFSAGTVITNATAGTDFQAPLSLTNVGSSGASTLISNVLNIPIYTGGGGGGGTGLTPTATKTANFNFLAGNYCPVNTTSGAITGTLPTAPADGTVVAAKMIIQGALNALTIVAGGSDVINFAGNTSNVLPYSGQERWYQYQASTSTWFGVASDNGTRNTGDFLLSQVANTTLSLVSSGYGSPTSLSLPPGDWDVYGVVGFIPAATMAVTALIGGSSLANNSLTQTDANFNFNPYIGSTTATLHAYSIPSSRYDFRTATTNTTVFLIMRISYSGGGNSATGGGTIRARRWR